VTPERDRSSFPELQEIALKTLKNAELIELAKQTLHALVAEQDHWRQEDPKTFQRNEALAPWFKTRQGLAYQEKRAGSLKASSKVLNDRILNEMSMVSAFMPWRSSSY
jgi:hypothetical protein